MTGPVLSVLMPCRNAAPVLPEAVASLEAQTYPDFEVLAVDDGSADETFEILREWARRDPRVRPLRSPGRGLVAALDAAARSARGRLIGRMDADDVAEPGRFERQVAFLAGRPELAACGARVRYFPREIVRDGARRYEVWLNGMAGHEELARNVFVECPIAHPTLIIRAEAFHAVGGYRDRGWPEDYDLILRAWIAGLRFDNVPEVLLHWREGPHRASRVQTRYGADAFRRCKVHHLRRSLLRGRDGAVVWGAGPVGKSMARELGRQGVHVRAFVDLDPRKIGQTVHGVPVVDPNGIHRYRGALALAAVGSPGARDEIRAALSAAGWRELVDWCAVA